MSTAIEFNNISKQYRLGVVSGGTIRADFQRWWQMNIRHQEDPFLKVGETNDRASKGNSEYVWALKDIDFKVEQGDVVGIIGKNGAGKSTLLKILSKVTGPTTGTIRAKGRIGSLLEVGTGFHPEMTGRENIYLNGAILGMSKPEIKRKLDEIVDFSGCERYIDTPVKRYSSGMMVRLGFAVAAHLDPEILVVDEVLAVGDAEFQKKAIGKMQDVSKCEGRTVLFVSHNMTAVRNLCHRGILLENGMINSIGGIDDIVEKYLSQNKNISHNVFLPQYGERFSSGEQISIEDFKINLDNPKTGDEVRFNVVIQNNSNKETEIELAINFSNRNEIQILEFHSKDLGQTILLKKGENIIQIVKKDFPLLEGDYSMNIFLGSNGRIIDWCKQCFVLHIGMGKIGNIVPQYRGVPIFLPCEWVIN